MQALCTGQALLLWHTPHALRTPDCRPDAQNWVSYMAPMRNRGQFKHATALGSAIMTACFVAVGAIGYHKLGTNFDHTQPITTALPSDRLWTPVMNAGLLAHCILAYQVRLPVSQEAVQACMLQAAALACRLAWQAALS